MNCIQYIICTDLCIEFLYRDTAAAVSAAGFSEVKQKKYYLPSKDDISPFLKVILYIVKRHVMGVATL